MKKNILFLCTGNSCRSQIAEGWGRELKGELAHFYSAGTKKHGLNEYAIKVMKEVGVDISKHHSKTISELGEVQIDIVFTVCSDAHETCPYFPQGKTIHAGFDDPPRLARGMEKEEDILNVYRRVRNEIKEMILGLETYLEVE